MQKRIAMKQAVNSLVITPDPNINGVSRHIRKSKLHDSANCRFSLLHVAYIIDEANTFVISCNKKIPQYFIGHTNAINKYIRGGL
jgi:hypothetical protein